MGGTATRRGHQWTELQRAIARRPRLRWIADGARAARSFVSLRWRAPSDGIDDVIFRSGGLRGAHGALGQRQDHARAWRTDSFPHTGLATWRAQCLWKNADAARMPLWQRGVSWAACSRIPRQFFSSELAARWRSAARTTIRSGGHRFRAPKGRSPPRA